MRTVLLWGALLVPTLASADADEVARRLDALYAERHVPARLRELDAATAEALKAAPDDARILWRAARLEYWKCDGATDSGQKRDLGKKGAELGERAVARDASIVEAHYFAAIALGCYSQAVGILRALAEGLEGRFNERLEKALSVNPRLDFGGPLIAKGRYYFELPWPKRDLKRSAELLQAAIRAEPASLRAWLYLAETQLRDGAAQKAKQTLSRALEGDEGYDVAEARRVKAWAAKLMKTIEEELK